MRRDPWFHSYVAALSQNESAAWRAQPVNVHPHECAFYPVWLLREFTRALKGTHFERALDAQQAGSSCPCCAMYRVSSRWKAPGSCNFEELLLPTFVWQHHAPLVAHASPPAALRVWSDLNRLQSPGHNAFSELACYLMTSPPGLGHFFAVKVPHFYFGRISAYLRRALNGHCIR
mmetsp:Transcript_37533/g.62144  ORF Transcript_37533/g.62144 Transcript_37533/m.62144 type:complete len:175 (+) Transcript_37533:3-527(+)